MIVLEQTKQKIVSELPHCKSNEELLKLLKDAQTAIEESKAPFGQKQQMWADIKEHLSGLSRRPDIINYAHSLIDSILKRHLMI
jgi:hypothetical protein